MQKIAKNSPFKHHSTTLLGYVFATKARIDNRKKKLAKHVRCWRVYGQGQNCYRIHIYIPPGNIYAIELLNDVIARILISHSNLLICMDANSGHASWDNSCISIPHSRQIIKIGIKLEQIIDKYDLCIHNTGLPTYCFGDIATPPDVTNLLLQRAKHGMETWFGQF